MLEKILMVCIFHLAVLLINTVVAKDQLSLVDIKAVAKSYIDAEKKQTTYPLSVSENIELAYLIQANYVQQKNKSIIGYKVGLSSVAAQNKFNYHSPVFGVLLNQDKRPAIASERAGLKILLELELAFQIKDSIDSLEQLDQPMENLISAVIPVVELPIMNFKDINEISAFDIVATNVGAAGFITGGHYEINDFNLNHLQVELWNNNEKVMVGLSSAPLNNQLDALRWLLKQTLLQGYNIEQGHVLLTGSILQPVLIRPGRYTARFHDLEEIDFYVE